MSFMLHTRFSLAQPLLLPAPLGTLCLPASIPSLALPPTLFLPSPVLLLPTLHSTYSSGVLYANFTLGQALLYSELLAAPRLNIIQLNLPQGKRVCLSQLFWKKSSRVSYLALWR